MALRRPAKRAEVPELAPVAQVQLVRLADVAAEAAGQPPGPEWISQGEGLAVARDDVVLDWAGRSCIPWPAAAILLAEIRQAQAATQATRVQATSNQSVGLAGGVVGIERPGESPVMAPWMIDARPGHGSVEVP